MAKTELDPGADGGGPRRTRRDRHAQDAAARTPGEFGSIITDADKAEVLDG